MATYHSLDINQDGMGQAWRSGSYKVFIQSS